MTDNPNLKDIKIALAWCLAWGSDKTPQYDQELLEEMSDSLREDRAIPQQFSDLIQSVEYLLGDDFTESWPKTIQDLTQLTLDHSLLWNHKIGLVYGGATKIKQYVFESEKLPYIRGASALLDRINLEDIPGFFGKEKRSVTVDRWLDQEFVDLRSALIPELLIYYKGGNILAFCPAAWVNDLANAIEKRYTSETLTANSCAVGATFKPLEIRLGLLPDQIDDQLFWLDKYQKNHNHPLVQAYFNPQDSDNPQDSESFKKRKSFNELVTHLAIKFNQRRSGNDRENRPSRCYPPMLETHPFLVRDISDRRLALQKVTELPNEPNLSEVLARKRLIGEIAKRQTQSDNLPQWYQNLDLEWHPRGITRQSWVAKFEEFLVEDNQALYQKYYDVKQNDIKEALSLREIGNVYQGFVGYIYADGNNMGGYIQTIQIPQDYKRFSEDIFEATEKSVYTALAKHLHPHQLQGLSDPDNRNRNGTYIHPFEIITIGGDDVLLIVPAHKALAIAQTIGEEFETILLEKKYTTNQNYAPDQVHRYRDKDSPIRTNQCQLSMSAGVLITAENTPIYYAQKLTEQLLKSAKEKAKNLKKVSYLGGTIDFLVLKSVTMLSSSIKEFRREGLSKKIGSQKLRFYASPYTLHEIGGLLESIKAFQESKFPRSQLYQIRSLLEQGKRTAILNYRYFYTRLKQGKTALKDNFEDAWCNAKTNNGNLAPWMFDTENSSYETIWRDIVDLYFFTEQETPENTEISTTEGEVQS